MSSPTTVSTNASTGENTIITDTNIKTIDTNTITDNNTTNLQSVTVLSTEIDNKSNDSSQPLEIDVKMTNGGELIINDVADSDISNAEQTKTDEIIIKTAITTSSSSSTSTVKNVLPLVYIPAAKPSNNIIQTTQNPVILTPLKSQVIFQKSIVPATKLTGTYLTMLKPVNETKKCVLSPMPKLTTNRLPVTATTNSKIAFMPIPIASTTATVDTSKRFNIRIADGKIDNDTDDVKQPKFLKHGISILKKHYPDRKSDNTNNEFKVLPTLQEETKIVQIPDNSAKKAGRRKSNVAYRKDYDEMEVEELNQKSEDNNNIFDSNNTENECEKLLEWKEGIGSLPGSKLKFIMNEFNMLEYVPEDEYKRIMEKKMNCALKPNNNPPAPSVTNNNNNHNNKKEVEVQCLKCGCFGLASDFISPKYCSYDCQKAANKTPPPPPPTGKTLGRPRKRKRIPTPTAHPAPAPIKVKDTIKSENESDDEMATQNSNENSQDKEDNNNKTQYPWSSRKGFSWAKYLDHVKAKAAPVKLFKDAFPYSRNGFRPYMKLEGIDPLHPSYFCVLTVEEVIGYRLRLHFDGYDHNYDFWVNADSTNIFPVGWCEKFNRTLQPPYGYTMENFNWITYLKKTRSTAAPKHLFVNRSSSSICPNGFRIGMKLEAVDRKNTSLVCVATVRDMMDSRILVHFDGWDDIYDYWADPTSPYIHPIGWCDQYGHNLTPPSDYPDPENFTWEKYLKETKTVAAPVRAFKQRPACGFKRGMRLECVDKRVPALIRVATVEDVREHQVRIQFDGWPDKYSYWVDDDSTDIHPIGWCKKTGHPIEPPLTPDDVYDFMECPTVGCRGLGHTNGPQYPTHSSRKNCPYADENLDLESRVLPDRLLSPDRTLNAVIPVQREPKDKLKVRTSPKIDKDEPLDYEEKPEKRKYKKRIKLEPFNSDQEMEKASALIEDAKIMPAERETIKKHSQFLKKYIRNVTDPRTWTIRDVSSLINSIPGIDVELAETFEVEEIDGESLLLLSQSDIINNLEIKVGPAVKLYNIIVMLRQQIKEGIYS